MMSNSLCSLDISTQKDIFSEPIKNLQASGVIVSRKRRYQLKADKNKKFIQKPSITEYSGLNYLGKEYYFAWAENFFFIEQYFAYSPEERVKNSGFFDRYVKTSDDVLFVLKCATYRDTREGFDGGVAILAECSEEILIEMFHRLRQLFIHSPEKAKIYENYWEILILAIACAKRLSEMQKFQLFQSLFVNNLGRAVKTSLIDGLRLLDFDPELIKICLERFLSPREQDDYIRAYAQEAIDDLS
jgi:hypothetical protein